MAITICIRNVHRRAICHERFLADVHTDDAVCIAAAAHLCLPSAFVACETSAAPLGGETPLQNTNVVVRTLADEKDTDDADAVRKWFPHVAWQNLFLFLIHQRFVETCATIGARVGADNVLFVVLAQHFFRSRDTEAELLLEHLETSLRHAGVSMLVRWQKEWLAPRVAETAALYTEQCALIDAFDHHDERIELRAIDGFAARDGHTSGAPRSDVRRISANEVRPEVARSLISERQNRSSRALPPILSDNDFAAAITLHCNEGMIEETLPLFDDLFAVFDALVVSENVPFVALKAHASSTSLRWHQIPELVDKSSALYFKISDLCPLGGAYDRMIKTLNTDELLVLVTACKDVHLETLDVPQTSSMIRQLYTCVTIRKKASIECPKDEQSSTIVASFQQKSYGRSAKEVLGMLYGALQWAAKPPANEVRSELCPADDFVGRPQSARSSGQSPLADKVRWAHQRLTCTAFLPLFIDFASFRWWVTFHPLFRRWMAINDNHISTKNKLILHVRVPSWRRPPVQCQCMQRVGFVVPHNFACRTERAVQPLEVALHVRLLRMPALEFAQACVVFLQRVFLCFRRSVRSAPFLFPGAEFEEKETEENARKRGQKRIAEMSPLDRLRHTFPDMFVANYSRTTNCRAQPHVLLPAQVGAPLRSLRPSPDVPDILCERLCTFAGETIRLRVLEFPPRSARFFVAYDPQRSDIYPYIGLQRNLNLPNREQFPYLPCCFAEDPLQKDSALHAYWNTNQTARRTGANAHIVNSLKPISHEAYGCLAADTNLYRMMVLTAEASASDIDSYMRVGILPRSINAALHCLLFARNPQRWRTCSNDAEREQWACDERQRIVAGADPICIAQDPAAFEELKDAQRFFDPRRIAPLLEAYFQINLLWFTNDSQSMVDDPLVIFAKDATKPTVLLYFHQGRSGDHVMHPIVDLIACGNGIIGTSAARFLLKTFWHPIHRLYRKEETNYRLIYKPIMRSKLDHLDVDAQWLDFFGRCRAVRRRGGGWIGIDPFLPPLPSVPLVRAQMHFVRDGSNIESLSSLVHLFPLREETPAIDIDFVSAHRTSRRYAHFLLQGALHLFTQYVKDRHKADIEMLRETDWMQYFDEWRTNAFCVDDTQTTDITDARCRNLFHPENPLFTNARISSGRTKFGRLRIPCEEIGCLLCNRIRLLIGDNVPLLRTLIDRPFLSGFFESRHDFCARRRQVVLIGEAQFRMWRDQQMSEQYPWHNGQIFAKVKQYIHG